MERRKKQNWKYSLSPFSKTGRRPREGRSRLLATPLLPGENLNNYVTFMSPCIVIDKTKTYPLSELFYICSQIHPEDLLSIWCLVLSSLYKREHAQKEILNYVAMFIHTIETSYVLLNNTLGIPASSSICQEPTPL